MTMFHEGQEVEVLKLEPEEGHQGVKRGWWRNAKIVRYVELGSIPKGWLVQFPDGTRDVFDAEHIRAVARFIKVPGSTCIEQHEECIKSDQE